MFERVLVPTDFSKYARKVLECVGQLPGVKEVVLLNVIAHDPLARVWDPTSEMRDVKAELDRMAVYLSNAGFKVKTRVELVLEGEIQSVIDRVADEEGTSLVVMGARGRGVIESLLLGSVSRSVLRYADDHLLIMKYKLVGGREGAELQDYCSHIFTRVLFPTDLSEPARVAISLVSRMAGVKDVVLLHVVSKGESREEIEARSQQAANTLQAMADDLSEAGISAVYHVVVGNPADEIRSVAEKENASLIVMSSVGKNSSMRAHIGGTAYDVANTADRPVLIIRAGKPPYT